MFIYNYKLLIGIVSCILEQSIPHERIHMWPSKSTTKSNMILLILIG